MSDSLSGLSAELKKAAIHISVGKSKDGIWISAYPVNKDASFGDCGLTEKGGDFVPAVLVEKEMKRVKEKMLEIVQYEDAHISLTEKVEEAFR